MKKYLWATLAACLIIAGCGYLDFNTSYGAEVDTAAETTTETSAALDLSTLIAKLPSLKNSICYSYDDNEVKYAMSFAVMGFIKKSDGENLISVDAMYVPATEIGAMATVKLLNLGKYVTFPILDYINIRPGVYCGVKNIGSGSHDIEFDWGGVVSIIDVKF